MRLVERVIYYKNIYSSPCVLKWGHTTNDAVRGEQNYLVRSFRSLPNRSSNSIAVSEPFHCIHCIHCIPTPSSPSSNPSHPIPSSHSASKPPPFPANNNAPNVRLCIHKHLAEHYSTPPRQPRSTPKLPPYFVPADVALPLRCCCIC